MKKYFLGMCLTAATLASCASNGNESVAQSETAQVTYSNVSVTDLKAVSVNPQNAIIIDVRTDGEVAEGMVENAIQIDVNGAEFNEKAAKLDKAATVYVYCRSGARSQRASQMLVEMGFSDVRNVEGGYLAYQKL